MENRIATVDSPRSKASGKTALMMPPVIILNLFHSGLGIARQLAGSGVRVVGFSAHPRIYGNFSRLCEVWSSPNSQEEPKQLANFLLRAASDLPGAVIFPTRDADLLFLDRFRSDLEPFYKLAIPPTRVLFRVLDKSAVAETAAAAGILVPRTAVVREGSQLQSAAQTVGYPCVLKPVSSVHWRQGNNWKRLGARKAFRVANFADLQREYERISAVRSEMLLQEWIPGATDQILVWGGYLCPQGEPPTYFTARKIVQSPAEFGTGCVVESDLIPDLLEPSVRLCRALGYQGIADIEFKRDARDGKLKLIEINARHWDWHELGRASEVNLTWIAYCDLTRRPIPPARPTSRHAKWVAEDALLLHVVSSIYRRESSPLKHWKEVRGRRMYGIFSWRDPMPFMCYSTTELVLRIAGAVFRKIRQRTRKQQGTTH